MHIYNYVCMKEREVVTLFRLHGPNVIYPWPLSALRDFDPRACHIFPPPPTNVNVDGFITPQELCNKYCHF